MKAETIKVLVIDDEEGVRCNLNDFLEDEGFAVYGVESGEEALRLLEKEQFDIAIVDIRLPGIDGTETIIRAHKLQSDLKYLIHTGSSDYTLNRTLINIGIQSHNVYTKPMMDMFVLVQAIEQLIKKIDER